MVVGRDLQRSVDQPTTKHGLGGGHFSKETWKTVFPWAALAQLPAAKPSGLDGSSHMDAHEMSPDKMTPHAQARFAGSQLRDGKTHVALQSPAVVQNSLQRTTVSGFLENWLAALPFTSHGVAGWQCVFGVLGHQLHTGSEHHCQPRWIN